MSEKLFFNARLTGLMLLLIGLTLTTTGCDIKMPWDQSTPAAEKAAEEEAATEEAPEEETPKLDMKLLLPPAMINLPAADLRINMTDGMLIAGKLYDPSLEADEEGEVTAPEAGENGYEGHRYPLVVLLPGLNHDQSVWNDLPATLVKAGYAVFAMDLRGHGKSIRTARGRRVDWRLLSKDEWPRLARDVNQVLDYFKKGEDYPEINAEQVVLAGERMGATIAAQAAKRDERIKVLVLMSPEDEIKGYDAGKALIEAQQKVLVMVSEDEKETFTTAKLLYNMVPGPKTMQIYRKAGQGSDMLINQPSIGEQFRDWLLQALPSGNAAPAPAEGSEETKEAKPATDTEHGHEHTPDSGHGAASHEAPAAHH